MQQGSLRSDCSGVIVVAHNEDTTLLVEALNREGLQVEQVLGPYTSEQQRWSAAMRCFVNHAHAWRIAEARTKPTIIVEADFVPVKGFGGLPIPAPSHKVELCLPYLYACGPQIWQIEGDVARGHAGSTVALILWPRVAALLLEFFGEKVKNNPAGAYLPFDTQLGYWLNARGIECYLPYRQYGEHGGIPNPEHSSANLGRPHQADTLCDSLAFLPFYARRSLIRFWSTRFRARVWGWGRLLTGRVIDWQTFRNSERWPMTKFVVGRLLG
jgi:hypothetical protein